MNATFFNADHLTHLKIIVLGLLGAILVVWVAITAHLGAGKTAQLQSDAQARSPMMW